MKESSSPETKTGNKAIIQIQEKGLCYHPDWPVHPKDHPSFKSGMDQYSEPLETNGFWINGINRYEKAITKAISEAVLFDDQHFIEAVVKMEMPDRGAVWEGVIENHPYPIPEQYEVTVKIICKDESCPGGCVECSGMTKVAYLLPLKESTAEKKFTDQLKHIRNICNDNLSRVEAGENKRGVDNLLPCPFCGSQPEWINEALADSHYYIRCPHCHIVMKEDRRDKAIGIWNYRQPPLAPPVAGENKPENPDKKHFDKMLLKELVWKLDREIWAHVQNPNPSEEWSTSKAREESRNAVAEYIGDYDTLREENKRLIERMKERNTLKKFKRYVHERLDAMGIPADPEPENNKAHGCRIEGRLNVLESLKTELDEVRKEVTRLEKLAVDRWAEIEKWKSVVTRMYAIRNTWLPDDDFVPPPQHEGEYQALGNLLYQIESLLNPEKKITPNGAHPE